MHKWVHTHMTESVDEAIVRNFADQVIYMFAPGLKT
jgi:hypothetical protein